MRHHRASQQSGIYQALRPLALAILALVPPSCAAPVRAWSADTRAARATGAARQASAEPADWNLSGPAPHLLAHYVPWYQVARSATDHTLTWEHWKWDGPGPRHEPAVRLADGRRDIASVYYPLIGPYSSWSRAVVRYHLKTAKAAGIQGFIVDWYGIGDLTDAPIPLLLDEAERLHMRVAICYEEKLNFLWRGFTQREQAIDNATKDLSYVVTRYASHPGYLRRNGMPAIFQFDGWGQGKLGANLFSAAELARILGSLPEPVAYCREGLTLEYHPPVAGAFQWWSSSARQLRDFGAHARSAVNDGRLEFFAGMISPGFDDTGVWGWGDGARVTPREGISLLKSTVDLCTSGDPELVQIVTWNDFNEGTVVEPTRETGFQYLDAIATWWAAEHHHRANLTAIRAPYHEYVRTCSESERAELPEGRTDHLLAHRALTVAVPDYLDVLDRRREQRAGK